jgi:protein TonB
MLAEDNTARLCSDPFGTNESVARRGARFVLVLALHLAVIAGGAELAARPEVRTALREIHVRLVELPPPAPEPPAVSPVQPPPVEKKPVAKPPPPPRPVLAAVAEAPAATTRFVVPPQPPVPPEPFPVEIAPPAPPPVVAARFDADYLHNPKPVYPSMSRRLGEEGTVRLRVKVGAGGTALTVETERSSGFGRLDAAALEAVRRWRFVPARRGDIAIEAWVAVPIVFKLES